MTAITSFPGPRICRLFTPEGVAISPVVSVIFPETQPGLEDVSPLASTMSPSTAMETAVLRLPDPESLQFTTAVLAMIELGAIANKDSKAIAIGSGCNEGCVADIEVPTVMVARES